MAKSSLNFFYGYAATATIGETTISADTLDASSGVFSKYHVGGNLDILPTSKVSPMLCRVINDIVEGRIALGTITDGSYEHGIAEVAITPDTGDGDEGDIMIARHNRQTGSVSCCIVREDGSHDRYSHSGKAFSGVAIFAAILPALLEDDEFKDGYNAIMSQLAGTPDWEDITKKLHTLTLNVFDRTNDASLKSSGVYVPVDIDKSSPAEIKPAAIKAGTMSPNKVLVGEFEYLQPTCESSSEGGTTTSGGVSTKASSIDDLKGKYAYGEEVSSEWLDQIPVMPEGMTINPLTEKIGKILQGTDIRNFGFVGPAGTGKTVLASQVAYAVGRPYFIKTCNANDEITDFIGMMVPDTSKMETSDMSVSDKTLLDGVLSLGGLSKKNICEVLGLPSVEDIFYDTEGAYEALTGKSGQGIDQSAAIAAWDAEVNARMSAFIQTIQANAKGGNGGMVLKYVPTPFMNAIKYGGVVEVQEPNTIIQPGTMVGLNSLLEKAGRITLPTGETIVRHPDSIVIMTTNGNYEGCRGMNQSVRDRLDIVYHMGNPDVAKLVERTAAMVPAFTDMEKLEQMAQIVLDMADKMQEAGIMDGTCGPRSLLNWAKVSALTGDIYGACLDTVISKLTEDEEAREGLRKRLDESCFAPKKRTRRR